MDYGANTDNHSCLTNGNREPYDYIKIELIPSIQISNKQPYMTNKPSNKIIAIYLIWGLMNLSLWLMKTISTARKKFYPFTTNSNLYNNGKYFDSRYYDFTEFVLYMIAPIIIYYIIVLLRSNR